MNELFPDTRKSNYGRFAQGATLLGGLYYGFKTKKKFWYYLLLFLVIAPIVYYMVYTVAPEEKTQ